MVFSHKSSANNLHHFHFQDSVKCRVFSCHTQLSFAYRKGYGHIVSRAMSNFPENVQVSHNHVLVVQPHVENLRKKKREQFHISNFDAENHT